MAGDRKEVFTIGLVGLAAIVLSAVIIVILSGQSSGYERAAADRAAHYARNAEQQITANCRISVPRDHADCVEQVKQAARDNQRKEQDLAAQWVTAWWTKITGAAAVVGVILSAFGFFLVWITFRAAREGNEIARGVARAELRPWVKIEVAPTKFVAEEKWIELIYEVTFTNIGQTTAEDFAFKIDAQFSELDHENVTAQFREWGGPPPFRAALMPGEARSFSGVNARAKDSMPWGGESPHKNVAFMVVASAFYRSAMDEEWHRTDRSFTIRPR